MSEVATMSISVMIEDGQIKLASGSKNTDSWEFWKPILDRLWLDEQMRGKEASVNKEKQGR